MLLAGAEGLARAERGVRERLREAFPSGVLMAASSLSREVATGWLHVSRINQGHLQADCDFLKEENMICWCKRRH